MQWFARRKHRFVAAILAAVSTVSLADHAGVFGYAGNVTRLFDRQSVRMSRVIDGDTIEIMREETPSSSSKPIRLHLLGIDAPELPDHHGAEAARSYIAHRLADRIVIVRLDGTQTLDADGSLRAYVFITPADCLNADAIRDGMAYADRREHHTYAAAFEQLERDARSHHRGLWNGLKDSDMPPWRQAWLKEYLARRKPAF